MTRFATLLAFALAAVLALTSQTTGQTTAQMRGQPVAVGAVVLCIGGGAVTVPVDADGNPAGPAHPCPDCMAAQFTAPVPGMTLPPRPATRLLTLAAPSATPATLPQTPRVHAPARAPPGPV